MNTISVSNEENKLQNSGFLFANELITKNGWNLIINKFEHIYYIKRGYETCYFEVKIDKNKIYISTPIKNTNIQFVTSFKDYLNASMYLEDKFNDFIEINS